MILRSSIGFFIVFGGIEPIACLVFNLVIKLWENLQKDQYVITGTHQKRQILFRKFVGEYTLFLPISLLFLKGENENWENLVEGRLFFKKSSGQKGKGETKYTICRGDEMFSL